MFVLLVCPRTEMRAYTRSPCYNLIVVPIAAMIPEGTIWYYLADVI